MQVVYVPTVLGLTERSDSSTLVVAHVGRSSSDIQCARFWLRERYLAIQASHSQVDYATLSVSRWDAHTESNDRKNVQWFQTFSERGFILSGLVSIAMKPLQQPLIMHVDPCGGSQRCELLVRTVVLAVAIVSWSLDLYDLSTSHHGAMIAVSYSLLDRSCLQNQ